MFVMYKDCRNIILGNSFAYFPSFYILDLFLFKMFLLSTIFPHEKICQKLCLHFHLLYHVDLYIVLRISYIYHWSKIKIWEALLPVFQYLPVMNSFLLFICK